MEIADVLCVGATVQYAGAGGREAPFDPVATRRLVMGELGPELRGRAVTSFRELDAALLHRPDLPAAVRYGVSQALLDAVARAGKVTMAEVVRHEWATGSALRPVPVFAQSGDERYTNVDNMILKGVDVLPHGLINTVEGKLGSDGSRFADYVSWVRDRVLRLRDDDGYQPVLHFDTYGTIGLAFDADTDRMAQYLAGLAERAAPFPFRIEHPVDAGSRPAQVEALGALEAALERRGAPVQIVVDEWCNTLEDIEVFVAARAADMVHVKTPDLGSIADTVTALLRVRSAGLLAYCGGTCNETDRSAQVCAQVAMACDADQLLAKPGMGVDEGLMIVVDEMARTAALASRRLTGTAP